MNVLFKESPRGKFYFWDGDWLGTMIAAGELWDAYLIPWMDTLKAGQVAVDVGAHVGQFSVYLGRRAVKVHAFEASPEVFELLVKNVEANQLTDLVVPYNVALYDKETSLAVSPDCAYSRLADGRLDYASRDCSGWLWLVPGPPDVYGIVSRTLDSFHLQDVALIKVDTEGGDLRVLQGATETIARYRPVICCEYNERPALSNGCSLQSYYDFMDSIQYVLKEVGGNGRENRDFVAVPR